MKEHISTSSKLSASKIFHFFKEFKKYPERYRRYCAQMDATPTGSNTITTKEIWNITLGQLDYVKITVKYTLEPSKEIRYEIIEGLGEGLQNRIAITENEGSTGLLLSFIYLDIYALFYGMDSEFNRILQYFVDRTFYFLEGRTAEMETGDLCTNCKNGHLIPLPGVNKGDKHISRDLICDTCGKETGYVKVQVEEKISASSSVKVD
ncbi:MAG: hypothetical protein HY223_05205 [Thaumarchaeota archaeon]|nr:hypothetical protein [Nitrososphaerota archaeon]